MDELSSWQIYAGFLGRLIGCSLDRLLIRLLACYSYHIYHCLKHTRLKDFSWPVHSANGLYLQTYGWHLHIRVHIDRLRYLTFVKFMKCLFVPNFYFVRYLPLYYIIFIISLIWCIFLDNLIVNEEKTLPLESQYIDSESGEEYKLTDKHIDIVSSKWWLAVCLNTH